MRSVHAYSPLDDGAYAQISYLEQRETYLEDECIQQAEVIKELESQINSLEEQLVKKTENKKDRELASKQADLVTEHENLSTLYQQCTTSCATNHENILKLHRAIKKCRSNSRIWRKRLLH